MNWQTSGANRLSTAWVGDTQVVYLLEAQNSLFTGHPEWVIHRKVSGCRATGDVIGVQSELGKAQRIAEFDADELQRKGF